MNRWFRFYDGVLDDPKVQRLEPALFKAWVNLLCLASRNGGQVAETDIAFCLRLSSEQATGIVSDLTRAGLIESNEGFLKPHNWDERQFKSDVTDPTAAERMRRHRNKDRNDTVTVTPPRADTEQIRESARKRATRLPDDWIPSPEDRIFATGLGFNDGQIDHHASRFRDFWRGKPGAGGTKLDWPATWRNWMRTESTNKKPAQVDANKAYWGNRTPGIL